MLTKEKCSLQTKRKSGASASRPSSDVSLWNDLGTSRLTPFSPNDITVGSESEYQTAVIGAADRVDLPQRIRESKFYANLLKQQLSGEGGAKTKHEIDGYFNANTDNAWENSWVRLPSRSLNRQAIETLRADLAADKSNPVPGMRGDLHKFFRLENGEEYIRIPVSYLLRLSLANALGAAGGEMPDWLHRGGKRALEHFISDNTSPEVYSLYLSRGSNAKEIGGSSAKETAKRFLLTQLLTIYANKVFDLAGSGQRTLVYYSPNPPMRQQRLNEIIPDSFYRDLFMNPCLAGWDKGEDKHAYMRLCHEVMSRSHLNTLKKLKEARIITNNLVVLPNTSNTGLANNGTHISIGSAALTVALGRESGFTATDEKRIGDLAIKVYEHFIPLFAGLYTAAPYRMDFRDFHPEKALCFLPHQLHYTHLRMLWRRWKKKAKLKFLNNPVTPFGIDLLDRAMAKAFGFKGDFIPDYRLISYLSCLLGTDTSSALNGTAGNEERLKAELMEMGVFDVRMALYQFVRMRSRSKAGFSGFEARYYSAFSGFMQDLAPAAGLQSLITAVSYTMALRGDVKHFHIPDTSFCESERRQAVFCCSIGVPTFYVRSDTKNLFLKNILKYARMTRPSKRYVGYTRVHVKEYRDALLRYLRAEAGDVIGMFGAGDLLRDMQERIDRPHGYSAHDKLTGGILDAAGVDSAFSLSAEEFNASAERYYRDRLRKTQFMEAMSIVADEFSGRTDESRQRLDRLTFDIRALLNIEDIKQYIEDNADSLVNETASPQCARKMILLVLMSAAFENKDTAVPSS